MGKVSFILICLGLSLPAAAGKYADATGIYIPDQPGDCRRDELGMDEFCIPVSVLELEDSAAMIQLAIAELQNPDMVPMLERLEQRRRQRTRGFEVVIDEYDDDIFRLEDGSILEKDSGYVGYVGYREEALLFEGLGGWVLCFDGKDIDVEILKDGGSHYSRSAVFGTIRDFENSEFCD